MMNHPLLRVVSCIISFAALAGIVLPVALFSFNKMSLDAMKLWLLISTFLWFAATPFWMDREKLEQLEEQEKTF
jgi:hypothetical protein